MAKQPRTKTKQLKLDEAGVDKVMDGLVGVLQTILAADPEVRSTVAAKPWMKRLASVAEAPSTETATGSLTKDSFPDGRSFDVIVLPDDHPAGGVDYPPLADGEDPDPYVGDFVDD